MVEWWLNQIKTFPIFHYFYIQKIIGSLANETTLEKKKSWVVSVLEN